MIRLIASDLDGTLLRDDKTISDWTRRVIHDVQDAGIRFVLASGRQLSNISETVERLDFEGTVLAANGALCIDVPDMTVRRSTEMDVDSMHAIIDQLRERVPSLRIAVSRDLGRTVVGEIGYDALNGPDDHERTTRGIPEEPAEDLLSIPTLKILARAPEWRVHDLYELAVSLAVPGITVIDGGAPFLEIVGEGVSKGSGLAALCASLDIDASEVLAIGDWLNDLEMLEWAGSAVAVANAHPQTLAVADRITASNNDDGVAATLAEIVAIQTAATQEGGPVSR